MRVNYTNEGGSVQIREVPDDADPKTYKWGILIGPPDLSDLPLSVKKIKELVVFLVLADFGNYQDTQGRRDEILEIILKVTGKKDKTLLKQILYIYQKEYLEG